MTNDIPITLCKPRYTIKLKTHCMSINEEIEKWDMEISNWALTSWRTILFPWVNSWQQCSKWIIWKLYCKKKIFHIREWLLVKPAYCSDKEFCCKTIFSARLYFSYHIHVVLMQFLSFQFLSNCSLSFITSTYSQTRSDAWKHTQIDTHSLPKPQLPQKDSSIG